MASESKGDSVNVKVAVRCRPLNKKEEARGSEVCVAMDGRMTTVTPPAGVKATTKRYTFDHSYFWDASQEQVYRDLAAPLIEKSLKGFNGTIFAYGQTGSGKTHSMMGEIPDARGIIPRLNDEIFDRIAEETTEGTQFLVIASYLEIYNEVIKDLLNPSAKQLKIREHPEMGIYVESLAELVVKSNDDVLKLLEQGSKVRKVAATNMNDRSSRSHACFILKIERKTVEMLGDVQRETTLNAKINLVDLAGSERASKTGATGARLKEGAAINQSLSSLGKVITALASGSGGHIPYRDSKLTRLLQQSLGGNALTIMIATVSPSAYNFDETVSTLTYANSAKNIKNEAKRNEDVNEKIIRELREEIDTLRKQLTELQAAGGSAGGNSAADEKVTQMEEMIANLERAKTSSWEEKQRLSKLYEEERRKNLANENKIKSVMQTIKEDNAELMLRMRALQHEKAALEAKFKKEKDGHLATRDKLSANLAKYQSLHADGGEDGPHKDELKAILANVERLHLQAEAETESLKALKVRMKENSESQLKQRAAAAAQRMLLQEDAELRAAIQEEERLKLQKENEARMKRELDEAKRRLEEEARRERQRIQSKHDAEAAETTERERQLEFDLLEIKSTKELLRLEMEQMKRTFEGERKRDRDEQRRAAREMKKRELEMFRQTVEAFEQERKAMEAKYNNMRQLLQQAVQDIVYLRNRNAELEKQLVAAATWDPAG